MKQEITVIWRTAQPLIAVVLLCLAIVTSSCTKELPGNQTASGDGMEVRVSFPRSVVSKAPTKGTEVGTDDENRLDRVTILIFNEGGTKLETILSEDVTASNTSLATTQPKWATDQTLIVRALVEVSKPKKIYAIANWSKTSFDKTTYTEAMLKEELTTIADVADINGDKAYPMLMSGSKAVASLSSQLYSVTIDMERQSSKIRANLAITTATQDLMPQIEWQADLATITVANVPNKSYIAGRAALPAGAVRLNSAAIVVDDTKPAAADQTVPASVALAWSESLYITENPVVGVEQASKDTSTYIIVQLPYKNRISGTVEHDNYYKFYINDARDAASPHKVLRNTIYNFNISILGIGSPINNLVPDVNVDGQLTVNSWEEGELDFDASTNYFNIDRTTIGFSALATSAKATIVTDVADWKLAKADGTTIFSFAEGKTAPTTIDGITYTLGGLVMATTITISKGAGVIDFATQKMYFEAKNLKVPFVVTADNGWIPNSVLKTRGWPELLLPQEGGLQLAMRGNVEPIDGKPAANDQTVVWSTENVSVGNLDGGMAMGESSYAKLAAKDAAKYPIGQTCKHLGVGWYLPSIDELKLIYDELSSLGASYKFDAIQYWSLTEADLSKAKTLEFGTGAQASTGKSGKLSARCVKGTIPPPAAISVTPTTEANIPAGGDKYTVKVTSNAPWSASSSLGGVTFSPSSGAAGTDVSVEITVPNNAGAADRNIVATFTAIGGTTATTTWTGAQAAAPIYIEIAGLKWATGNLVADGANDAKIGAPADYGLYFMFGSLLGWKGGATGDGTGICTKADKSWFGGSSFNAVNEIAVKPSAFITIADIGTTWPDQTQNLYYFGDNTYATAYAKLRDFTGFSAGTLADKGVGDPCRFYLGSPWRLPTAEEWKALCNNAANNSSPATANAAWTTSPALGMNFNNSSSSKLFIPASGYRYNSDGSFNSVGTLGYYWSESVFNAAYGYCLRFLSDYVGPQSIGTRRYGFPARCVQ